MKLLLLFVSIVMAFSFTTRKTVYIQKINTTDTVKYKRERVSVTDWGSRALYLSPTLYFKETKDDLISKIGNDKFEDLQFKCSASGWPAIFSNSVSNTPEGIKKMNELKMYRIAVYQHKFNGNTFERSAVLEIPYAENADWDATVKWEGNIYFLLNEKDVKLFE
jgi:hypothetical protein